MAVEFEDGRDQRRDFATVGFLSDVSCVVCEKGSGPAASQSRGTYSGVS